MPTQSGQNLQEAIAQVQQIYEKVGVRLHITTEKPFDISDQLKNGTLPTENEFGDLSTYSPEQNAVIAKFTTNRKPKENIYYIFLVNDGTGDRGYMRLGGQYGFVYSVNARTIAHELGHGIFKLEHPFKGKNADKGKTTALMDYNEGQDFFYRDWKQINDPKVKLYAFQGQSEGKNVGEGQAHYVCIDDNLRKILYDKGYHFYNINGEPIELSSQDFTVAFMGGEEGTYYGRLGMVNHRGVYHSYAILNKNPQGYYINNYSKSKFVPQKGSKEKAVWVRINNKGEYLIENSDKTISVKGKTEIVDCLSFITIKSAEQKLSNSLLEEGISEETIKLFLGKGLSADSAEYKEIESFAKYLSTILKGKKWGFLYKSKNDYKEHYGESLFLNVLKDKKIFSEKAFKESFVIRLSEKDKPYYIKDVDLLISNFDPWEGIPEYYNAYSFDYTTFNIPNLDSEQVIDELLNTLEIVLNSSLDACPKCLTQEQKETLEAFIAKRRTKEGKKFILTNKLKERNNFIAAFQLLGAYDRYYYSIKDLEKRSFLADNNWLGEISRREKAGQASAIDIQGGHNQYVAYYGTTSAFFLGFQYFKMYGDLLDLAITNKAINESQRILSKNFKKVWGKGIGNVGKTLTEASSIGKYTKEAIAKEKGFTDILPNLLKKEGLTMDDFHYMMQKHVNALTPNEIKKLTRIRKAIPKPDENTLMQKVITEDMANKYLDGTYNTIGGSVARAVDTKHLKTIEDYYYGLRLDYEKTLFSAGDKYYYAIRFKTRELDNLVIPTDHQFTSDYPFTRNGFTSGNNGRLGIPEYVFDKHTYVSPQIGAEIWRIKPDGTEELIGVFKKENNIERFYKIK